MEASTNQEEVFVDGHPFKTTFPPVSKMSHSEMEERMEEMKRRAALPAGVVVGRSRGYIPYERDSNCDFSGASSRFPLALAIDGTGHDKGGDAAKHSENGGVILREVEACVAECLKSVRLPQQLADRVLGLLQALEASDDTRIHHMSCTLSLAIKVEAKNKTYAVTFHWGDNVVFIVNPTKRTLVIINRPLNSDYGIGATHSVSSRNQRGEVALPYSVCVRELDADDHIVCVTDGVWDHLVTGDAAADSSSSRKQSNGPEELLLDVPELLDLFRQTENEEEDNDEGEMGKEADGIMKLEKVVARLFEEARGRARAKLEAGQMREAELDDMSAFVIPPSAPAVALGGSKGGTAGGQEAKAKGCSLA